MSEDPAPYYVSSTVVAVIQARLGSSRLPQKVLRPINGRAMILRILDRLRLCQELNGVCAAIPYTTENLPLKAVLTREFVTTIEGPEIDLVSRFGAVFHDPYQGNPRVQPSAIVRITADCPMVDPQMVDDMVREWRADPGVDYLSNCEPGPRTYPDGLDIEILSRAGFDKIDQLSKLGDREPITTWVWKHPERFRVKTRQHSPDLGHVRWTVDTAEDLAGVQEVFRRLPEGFTMDDVLREFGTASLPEIGKGILPQEAK